MRAMPTHQVPAGRVSDPAGHPRVAAPSGVLRVAVLGAGNVGGPLVRAFLDRPDRFTTADGAGLELAGVAVRDLAEVAGSRIPAALLTDAPAHLVASPDADVVVELMGGIEPARTLIAAALGAGKPVVTANKNVLAMHGRELEELARRTGTPLRFEAAVAGGVPLLGSLAAHLGSCRVQLIRGIVNGTTNFILSEMAGAGRSYEEALAAARQLGYAEADPSGDVEGHDAAYKLSILARLAFGGWIDPAAIQRRPPTAGGAGRAGITGVTQSEVEGRAIWGSRSSFWRPRAGATGRSPPQSCPRPCLLTGRSGSPRASSIVWRSMPIRSVRWRSKAPAQAARRRAAPSLPTWSPSLAATAAPGPGFRQRRTGWISSTA